MLLNKILKLNAKGLYDRIPLLNSLFRRTFTYGTVQTGIYRIYGGLLVRILENAYIPSIYAACEISATC